MSLLTRAAVLAAVGAVALALAGNALATQKLEVSQTTSPASVTIRISQAGTDPQPAKVTTYVPAGYALTLGQAAGAKIGTTEGEVVARDLGGISLPLSGDVVVDDAAKHLTDICAPGPHAAVWILQLSLMGQSIALPVYVDPTSGAETALGSAKLAICLGPSDAPRGTPRRSPLGAQLGFASFTVGGVLTPPSGAGRWTAFTIPYSPGTGAPDPAGTVETRAFVGPGQVTLSAKVTSKRKKQVAVSGRVTQAGLGVATDVDLLVNGRARASATASASGRYAKKVKGTGRRIVLQARVTAPARDVGSQGCANPTQPPIRCVSATAGAFTATGPRVTVRF